MNSICAIDAAQLLEQANRLLANRRLHQAGEAFDHAQSAGADADQCSGGRWFAAMLGGDFEAAWRESDAIRARGTSDPHRFWNGERLEGARVIVRCLHGLGDAVQMLLYTPRLQAIASRVIFEVPLRLLSLAPLFKGVVDAITWDHLDVPSWDVQIEAMELPYLFRTTTAELPIATSYLQLSPGVVENARRKMGAPTGRRVGLAWAGGEWNRERSVSAALLQSWLQQSSLEFWSLQGDAAASDAAEWIRSGTMRDATAICGDGLLALAATIENLDIVITVDTLAAHLAGALGKRVWVMLQYAADWRWMTARDDSPWYPTMQLFRQPAPGDWRSVIDAIEDELEGLLAAAASPDKPGAGQ